MTCKYNEKNCIKLGNWNVVVELLARGVQLVMRIWSTEGWNCMCAKFSVYIYCDFNVIVLCLLFSHQRLVTMLIMVLLLLLFILAVSAF